MAVVRLTPAMVAAAIEATAAGDKSSARTSFRRGDFVVYPTHGVGKVDRIGVEEIAGHRLHLIHITFEENRMSLRVPVTKARETGLRKLATRQQLDGALRALKGRPKVRRTMWSRRATEYMEKINSGDLIAASEVVRDLWTEDGADASYSQRTICDLATDRVAAEFAAIRGISRPEAVSQLARILQDAKSDQSADPPEEVAVAPDETAVPPEEETAVPPEEAAITPEF